MPDKIKIKADKFVNDKKLKLNYIKPKDLKILLAEFCEEQIAELKAECDLAIEGRDVKIKELEAQIEKMKVKWHDLEKDPNDLPKNCKTMCICLGDFGSKYQPVPQVCIGYCDSLGWSDYMGSSLYSTVRYWCELPK